MVLSLDPPITGKFWLTSTENAILDRLTKFGMNHVSPVYKVHIQMKLVIAPLAKYVQVESPILAQPILIVQLALVVEQCKANHLLFVIYVQVDNTNQRFT